MLASLLKSIGDSSTESEGIAELVVTAIGTGGRHYLCWKTPSGTYRQYHHGLPSTLEKWLFPADGSSRDFETLQVILSGEDTFWASDRYGEIKSQPSDRERKLRRATTINFVSPIEDNKRWTSYVPAVSRETERKRSSTFPSNTPLPDQIIQTPVKSPPKTQLRHTRSLSTDRPQRASYVPLLVRHRRMNWATRPRSHEELGTLKECPSPQLPGPIVVETKQEQLDRTSGCTCGCHGTSRKSQSSQQVQAGEPQKKQRPVYADAGIQTDDDPIAEHPSKNTTTYKDIQNAYGRRRAGLNDLYAFEYQSNTYNQRSSVYSEPCLSDRSSWYVPNPVMMGRMQDYFRSSNYFLGDSLQPQGMG